MTATGTSAACVARTTNGVSGSGNRLSRDNPRDGTGYRRCRFLWYVEGLTLTFGNGMSVDTILGPHGRIAKLWPDFESRPEQLAMAHAVEGAIRGGHHLMVEAGTGVGKSFAYLVPAIQAALADKNYKVVIATHTIALQEQILTKDIPFLQSVFGDEIKAVLVKGRGNYLSKRRLRVAQQKHSMIPDVRAAEQLVQIGRWSRVTHDGTRSDLPFVPNAAVWDLVESDSGNCLGRQCPTYGDCFYYQARRAIAGAQIFIVNHALFFTDLALRRSGASLLPEYKAVVFDEAHTVEDVAADHLGLRVTQSGIEYQFNKLLSLKGDRGLFVGLGDDESENQLRVARTTAEEFFFSVRRWLDAQGKTNGRVREPNPVPDLLSEELLKLASQITRIGEMCETDEERMDYTSSAERVMTSAIALKDWLGQSLPKQVYWIERIGEQQSRVALSSAPVHVGPDLRDQLYKKCPTVIMASATLSAGGANGFRYAQERLGLERAEAEWQGSPFDYANQCQLHLFRNMPDPASNGPAYEQAVLDKIPEYVDRTQGRSFVLFTSYSFLQRAARHLRIWADQNRYTLMLQGTGQSPTRLLEQFRTTPRSVLFGVDSFWQGVDVKGEALSNVIITKLPFSVPDRPIIEARMEAIEENGGKPFFEYSVPQAVIKLKQGFGRLIRTKSDSGLVVLFDPRVLTKAYGKTFREALPPCRTFIDGVEVP
jgi:ATP-dependent DNA helicase DinG